MPLRDDLLVPIAGANPSGLNLKYDRVFDQIKEARTEDDDTLPSGAWGRTAKKADFNLVVKLAGETLATRTKDLQLAAWLGEAQIKKEGAAMLQPVLQLLLALQQEFWETLHPEIDEGDLGLRAMPLEWAAKRYATLVYGLPITKAGISYFSYKSGRALGYDADASDNASKKEDRDNAISRGQPTAEDVDEAVAQSPKSLYASLDPLLGGARETLEELSIYCEEKYADDGPSFRKLRDSLEEVQNLVHSILTEKRIADPDEVVAEVEAEPEPDLPEEPDEEEPAEIVPAARASVPVRKAKVSGAAPESWDDAAERIHALALYMSTEKPDNPMPYLVHCAAWWGELQEYESHPPLQLMVPPRTEHRTGLKLAASEGDWSTVLATGMAAMAEAGARCWLDVHRYLWNAAEALGYSVFAMAVVGALRGLLAGLPSMPDWTFSDDTPVANAETTRWLIDTVIPKVETAEVRVVYEPAPAPERTAAEATAAAGEPDVHEEAIKLARGGNLSAATALLTRDAVMQTSGRMRSRRRVEIAELCLDAGNSSVAASILREVVAEMEQRRLDTWETKETVARPLALLLRSTPTEAQSPDWEARFARLCALDPGAALEITI